MSNETTPAIERVTDVLIEHRDLVCVTGDPDVVAYDLLDHALSVEEIARAIHASDQGPDVWDMEGEKFKDVYRENARAVRAALLGATS